MGLSLSSLFSRWNWRIKHFSSHLISLKGFNCEANTTERIIDPGVKSSGGVTVSEGKISELRKTLWLFSKSLHLSKYQNPSTKRGVAIAHTFCTWPSRNPARSLKLFILKATNVALYPIMEGYRNEVLKISHTNILIFVWILSFSNKL